VRQTPDAFEVAARTVERFKGRGNRTTIASTMRHTGHGSRVLARMYVYLGLRRDVTVA
jgi:hypothetical protein